MELHVSSGENWLITGGLGYIGAHVSREFISTGHNVFILDNLSTGKLGRLPKRATYIFGDMRNSALIRDVCARYQISGIVHLAAFKHARESRLKPAKYWINNVGATLGLIEGIQGTEVSKVIFSSSCSIYGNNPGVDENTLDCPQSPYAHTKKASEAILNQVLETQEIAFTSLRFFNIIGCGSFPLAYDSSEECLVPVIAKGMLSSTTFRIFGHTHPTADGTCVRDYLDVRDLASAHNIVADRMGSQLLPKVINVSSGNPITVLQVLTEFESVTGQKVRHEKVPADPADPISVWSHKSKVLTELGWVPRFTLRDSITSHWQSFNAPLI